MFWNRITGPSNAECAQANIFVPSGELAVNLRFPELREGWLRRDAVHAASKRNTLTANED
jgi:hypothetical protein